MPTPTITGSQDISSQEGDLVEVLFGDLAFADLSAQDLGLHDLNHYRSLNVKGQTYFEFDGVFQYKGQSITAEQFLNKIRDQLAIVTKGRTQGPKKTIICNPFLQKENGPPPPMIDDGSIILLEVRKTLTKDGMKKLIQFKPKHASLLLEHLAKNHIYHSEKAIMVIMHDDNDESTQHRRKDLVNSKLMAPRGDSKEIVGDFFMIGTLYLEFDSTWKALFLNVKLTLGGMFREIHRQKKRISELDVSHKALEETVATLQGKVMSFENNVESLQKEVKKLRAENKAMRKLYNLTTKILENKQSKLAAKAKKKKRMEGVAKRDFNEYLQSDYDQEYEEQYYEDEQDFLEAYEGHDEGHEESQFERFACPTQLPVQVKNQQCKKHRKKSGLKHVKKQ